jgi:predicted phosphodiesterase
MSPSQPSTRTNLFRPSLPTPSQLFLNSPTLFLAHYLYNHRPPITPQPPTSPPIKIVCLSDTHNAQPRVPTGTVLIHAGDLTINGTLAELQAQLDWINSLPHEHKVVVAGNHDLLLDPGYYAQYPKHVLADPSTYQAELNELRWGSITYLRNASTTLHIHGQSLRIYGAPQTPKYGNSAFQYTPASDVWANTVPDTTDILITHGPAKGHVDAASPAAGCVHLLREVLRVKPRLHICGHIHQARGKEVVDWGTVQWGYDRVNVGEGGLGVLLVMLGAWLWAWMGWVIGVRREGRTVFVNAAVEENEGKEVVVVVEM